LNTRSADAQQARQRKRIGGEINLLLFQQTTDSNYLAFYFLTALFFTGEAAFFATFLAGAFLAGAFIAEASFLAAGLEVLQLCRSGLICWADAPCIIGLLSLQVAPI
jgi:hypothetical protein